MAKARNLRRLQRPVHARLRAGAGDAAAGLGPWKDSVYLVGGLTPRYLVPARPPVVPAHAGTLDVDIVIDLQILADTEAYHTLEENLKRMGFERAENEQAKLSWRWQTRTEHGR